MSTTPAIVVVFELAKEGMERTENVKKKLKGRKDEEVSVPDLRLLLPYLPYPHSLTGTWSLL